MPSLYAGRNLTVRTDVTADLRTLGATFHERSGVRYAVLPNDLRVLVVLEGEQEAACAHVALPSTDPADLPFAHPQIMASAAQIKAWAVAGNRGVVRGPDGLFHPVALLSAEALHVARVKLFSCPRVSLPPELDPGMELFTCVAGRMIFAHIGELHIAGRELTDEELAACSIRRLRDRNGQQLETLALVIGNRSVFFPTRYYTGDLPVPQGGENLPLGWQDKGTGRVRLFACTAGMKPDGTPALQNPGDVVLLGADLGLRRSTYYFQPTAYAGLAGTFLDVQHQPSSKNPSGGLGDYKQDVANYLTLKRNGAHLGRHISCVGRVISRDVLDREMGQPSGMTVPATHLLREIWTVGGGTTVRVGAVTRTLRIRSEGPLVGQQQAADTLSLIVQTETGGHDAESVRSKLREVCANAGKTLLAALRAGLTLWLDASTDENVTSDGGQLDFGDFSPVTGWHQLGSLVMRNLLDMQFLARAAMIFPLEFYRDGLAAALLGAALPADVVARLTERWAEGYAEDGMGDVEPSLSGPFVDVTWISAVDMVTEWVLQTLIVGTAPPGSGKRGIQLDDLVRHLTGLAERWTLVGRLGVTFPGQTAGQVAASLRAGASVVVRAPFHGIEESLESADVVARLLLWAYVQAEVMNVEMVKRFEQELNTTPPLTETAG